MNKKDDKLFSAITDGKTKCQTCGHTQAIPPHRDKAICTYCMNTIKNTSKSRFRYMMYNLLNQEKEMKLICL